MYMGALLYAVFAPLDVWSAPETYKTIWMIRFGFVIPAIVLAVASSYAARLQKYFFEVCAAAIFVGATGLVMMLVTVRENELAVLMYPAGLVLVFLFQVFSGIRYIHALAINIFVVLLYNALAVQYQDILAFKNGGLMLLNNNYQFVSAGFVGALVSYLNEMLARREFAQRILVSLEQSEKRKLVEELAHQKLQERTRVLEAANQHKSEFLSNMSHELRTPLNAVLGFSEVLRDKMFGDLTAKQTRYVENIHNSGQHLLSLINDILDLSKIEAGRMDLDVSRFDVPIALNNAVTLIRERAARHGIGVDVDIAGGVGDIEADERKFKQILLNLLSNAVKFTPNGGRIRVFAALEGEYLEVSVADSGIGIAPEDQVAIFEQFRQVGDDSAKKAEGTGLGLALTRSFVELHGGSISVQSELGKGAVFSFLLPVHQQAAPGAEVARSAVGGARGQ